MQQSLHRQSCTQSIESTPVPAKHTLRQHFRGKGTDDHLVTFNGGSTPFHAGSLAPTIRSLALGVPYGYCFLRAANRQEHCALPWNELVWNYRESTTTEANHHALWQTTPQLSRYKTSASFTHSFTASSILDHGFARADEVGRCSSIAPSAG